MNANSLKLEGITDSEVAHVTAGGAPKRTETATTGGQSPMPGPRRKAKLGVGIVLILTVLGFAGFGWWEHTRTWVTTDNAYVTGRIHTISSRIAGNVTEVKVSEHQAVRAGEVLARLDSADLRIAQDKARAALAQAEALVAQTEAQVVRDEALANKAQLDYGRAAALFREATSAISKQEFDTAEAALASARASVKAAQAAVLAAQAQRQVAAAQVADVALQLTYTDIVAPVDGHIGRKNLEIGNRVQPGQALLALVQPEVWVTANFKETQLARLRPGQGVVIVLDSLPDRAFVGRVESLSPASGAQFALLPPDNATGNFTKIVQRVPVKIVFTDASAQEFAGRIAPGLSVLVKVRVRG